MDSRKEPPGPPSMPSDQVFKPPAALIALVPRHQLAIPANSVRARSRPARYSRICLADSRRGALGAHPTAMY